MPQEIRPLLESAGGWRRAGEAPFPTWRGQVGHNELHVVQSGIGGERAGRVARQALEEGRVDLVISAGFAGSLCPDFRLGQPLWAREVITLNGEGGRPAIAGFHSGTPSALAAFGRSQALKPARFLTVDRIHSKAELVGHFADVPTVVEMESAAIAGVARERGVPFLGIRTISDEWDEEIDWRPETVVNGEGVILPARVAWEVCRKPILLRSLLRLHGNSRVAGRALARVLPALVGLPEERLGALVEELRQPLRSSSSCHRE